MNQIDMIILESTHEPYVYQHESFSRFVNDHNGGCIPVLVNW